MSAILGALGMSNPWTAGAMAAAQFAPMVLGKIGSGRRKADDFNREYEDKLGKQILPQVIALRQQGREAEAKALLQQGVKDYYAGVNQYQGAGGDYAKVASQSLANQALQNTIGTMSTQMGLTYAPGQGFLNAPTPNEPQQGGQEGQDGQYQADNAAKASLYGLDAPTQQGDPFALPQTDEMKKLMSGQGYDPKTLAQMHASAMETPAAAGMQQMAQAKRALANSGFGFGSGGMGAGILGNVARDVGKQQVAANRDVDMGNAQVGMENFRLGTAMDQDRRRGNFDELNHRYGQATQALGGWA